MDKIEEYISEHIAKIRKMDRDDWIRELAEIAYLVKKHLFSQIPGISTIAGILVGGWVAGTFTNSPVKGFLSSVGLMKGGTHVVSKLTYRFLSVVLPVLAMAVTTYAVQKGMKAYREKQLEKNMADAALMQEELQAELRAKMAILDKAKEAGLLSESEHRTKVANLYQSYVRSDRSKIQETIIKKIEG
jgi:cell division protein FtsL